MNDYASSHINASPDPISSQELLLYIENDADLYRQQHTPIIKNLVTKKAQGRYNSAKAAVLFGYLVESGAKKYYTDVVEGKKVTGAFVTNVSPGWSKMFPKKVRDAVALELRDKFETEEALDNYNNSTFLPKKYLEAKKSKTAKKTVRRASSPGTGIRSIR